MHLIDEAIVFRIDDRRASQEFTQQCRASRSIDSSEPSDYAAAVEHRPFRFKKYAARLANWFCLALFGNPRAIALRVHTRTARKEDFRLGKDFEENACAVEIKLTIDFGITAARAGAVDHCIKDSDALRNLSGL